MQAGIWLAPFLVGQSSELFRLHPDWLLHNDRGEFVVATCNPDWGNDWKCYALDGTHPEAKKYLRDVFQTLRDIGFTYFKIDFIAAGIIKAKHYDSNATRAEAYREGMSAIRAGAGDAFILGCGAPMGASIGLVDSMRVSPDGAASWYPVGVQGSVAPGVGLPSIKYSLQSDISRQFVHRKWWINDPDVLIPRDYTTALNHDEVIAHLTIVGILGGSMFFSDDLRKLGEHRIQLMRQFSPPTKLSGRALDIMDNTYGSVFILTPNDDYTPLSSKTFVLVFLNWKDYGVKIDIHTPKIWNKIYKALNLTDTDNIDFSSLIFYDFWEGAVLRAGTKQIDIAMHGVKAFLVTIPNKYETKPILIGNTLNLTSQCDGRLTCIEGESIASLNVCGHHMCSRVGSFWIKLPVGLCEVDIKMVLGCNAHIQRYVNNNAGVYVEIAVTSTVHMDKIWGVELEAKERRWKESTDIAGPTLLLDSEYIDEEWRHQLLTRKEALRVKIYASISLSSYDDKCNGDVKINNVNRSFASPSGRNFSQCKPSTRI